VQQPRRRVGLGDVADDNLDIAEAREVVALLRRCREQA
jgi:hypothetical protein